jgi:predicted amidophosphoribosyltransferase
MKTQTSQQIIDYIEQNQQVSAKQIVDFLGFTQAAVFRQLKKLINQKQIQKVGRPPKVVYSLATKPDLEENFLVDKKNGANYKDLDLTQKLDPNLKIALDLVEQNYLYISPEGQMLDGIKGFQAWSGRQKLDTSSAILDYAVTSQKYDQFKQNGLISGLEKLKSSYGKEVFLDELYYLDFYAIERFGKTRLAQLTFQAKQSQDKNLVTKIVNTCKEPIFRLIIQKQIDAVAFVPATVSRKLQFQKEFARSLNLPLPQIRIDKIIQDTPVQQKTLKSQKDRIENAQKTFFINETRVFGNILLIDDFVGSGATLNELARKIKQKNLVTGRIYGLGLTGSFKGFEVISGV